MAESLLQQPQAQLRAHGLLAAKLAGRLDLVLGALDDPGVWKAAATFLCQMEPDKQTIPNLLHWLLHKASPVKRCGLLTRLGRLPPRPLGAALFEALREAGQLQDALRLVRHAEGLSDTELETMAREQLVAHQSPCEPVPTWARQAWKGLAVQRPHLCLELLRELIVKVRSSSSFGDEEIKHTPIHTLRRAVLTLLYGSVHQEAVNALLLSETNYCKNLEKADGSQGIAVDPLVLPSSGADSRVYSWYVPHASGRIAARPLASVGGCGSRRIAASLLASSDAKETRHIINLAAGPDAAQRHALQARAVVASIDSEMAWQLAEGRRLQGYILWTPKHQESVQALLHNQPVAEARAKAYGQALEAVPFWNALAVNEVVPKVLLRIKNERAFVREEVLRSLIKFASTGQGNDVLRLLGLEHVTLLEATLLGALAAPDCDEALQRTVATVASKVLRQGVLDPQGALLAPGLRLHRELLARCSGTTATGLGALQPQHVATPGEGSQSQNCQEPDPHAWRCSALDSVKQPSWFDPVKAIQVVAAPDTLRVSSDVKRAADALLSGLLPLYVTANHRRPALALLEALTAAGLAKSVREVVHGLPELNQAVHEILVGRFPLSHWTNDSGAHLSGAGCQPSAGLGASLWQLVSNSKGRNDWYWCLYSCLQWWLSGNDEGAVLQRAKALLGAPGGFPAVEEFVETCLCHEWLTTKQGEASEAARWWQEFATHNEKTLKLLVGCHPLLVRSLMERPDLGSRLCDTLLTNRIHSGALCGVVAAYDSVTSEAFQAIQQEGSRLAAMESALLGYLDYRSNEEPAGNYWGVNRRLFSRDIRRWPPATQECLRQLCICVLGTAGAKTWARVTAVCLLTRIQDASSAELKPLVSTSEILPACLLAAARLPDANDAAGFLLPWLASDSATHAASALKRIAHRLPRADFEELCEDMLSTVGLRAAAWQKIVTMLLQSGGAKAVALAYGEMQRPDLSPSMRCGLLEGSSRLVGEPQVAAFWEQCAGLQDKEVGAAVIRCANAEVLKKSDPLFQWWMGLVLPMLHRACGDPEMMKSWAAELTCSQAFRACKKQPAMLEWLSGSLTHAARLAAGWELMLDTAGAPSQEPPSALGGSTASTSNSGADSCQVATRLLRLLLAGPKPSISPWQAGCTVPPALVPLLWTNYSQHVASMVVCSKERVVSAGSPASLAATLEVALTAVPSSTHVMHLAAAVLNAQDDPPTAIGRFEGEVQAGWATVLQQASSLLKEARQNEPAALPGKDRPTGRCLLAAALLARAWMLVHEAEELSTLSVELLGMLLSHLATDSSGLVRLLLDQHAVTSSGWRCGDAKGAKLCAALDGTQAVGSLWEAWDTAARETARLQQRAASRRRRE
ncbi:hypothetical protein N2152v2_009775 [Parachlorella kessleri]